MGDLDALLLHRNAMQIRLSCKAQAEAPEDGFARSRQSKICGLIYPCSGGALLEWFRERPQKSPT